MQISRLRLPGPTLSRPADSRTTGSSAGSRVISSRIRNISVSGTAPCCRIVPAGQTLGDCVEIGDAGRCIRGDDSIPDTGQGDAEQFLFRSQDIVGLCQLRGALLNFASRSSYARRSASSVRRLSCICPSSSRLIACWRSRAAARSFRSSLVVEAQQERFGHRSVVACRNQRHHRDEQDQHRRSSLRILRLPGA